LEHVPDDNKALSEAFRILRPGGYVAVLSPNRLFPFESHSVKLRISNSTLPVYIPFIPYIPMSIGNHIFLYWARNYWPAELRRKIRNQGFEIVETDFIWQTFENISNMQPQGIMKAKTSLRRISDLLERTPILRSFGISQFILAKKP
jgi:ubiquinone/menaquinone biosynthesis C-methylase UbiE